MNFNEENQNDSVMGRFTIEDFFSLLEKSKFNEKILSTREYLLNQMYDNGIKKSIRNFYIDPIRDNVVFYRGMDNEAHPVSPSITRLINPLDAKIESHYLGTLLRYPFLNEDSNSGISIKMMARMQHYNYKSRLVDITVNPFVAIYMACYNSFTINGKLIKFAYINNTKNEGNVNQLKSLHFTTSINDSVKDNLRLLDSIISSTPFKQKVKNYTNQPVGIIDLQLFKTNSASYDLRYDAQEGAFIMFMNDYLSPVSPLQTKSMSRLIYEYIDASDKYSLLYLLAKNRITYVTIYPDKELSHEIIKIYNKATITTGISSLNNDISQLKNEFIELAHINKYDLLHIKSLCKKYYNDQSLIEFLLTDYIKLINMKKKLKSDRINLLKTKPLNVQSMNKINYEINIHNDGVNKLASISNDLKFKVQLI